MNTQEPKEIERLRFAISHEIRGAITIAKGYSEFARIGKFGSLDPKVEKAFESIERTADRIAVIASNLAEFIRLHYQEGSIARKKILNADFFKQALKNVRLEAKKKKISIQTYLSEDLSIWADPKALQLIVTNLLRNTIQFSSQKKSVTARIESYPDEFQLSVEDEGVGLSELDIVRIWTNPEAIQPEYGTKGACFGLRITKMLVELHNGTIEVFSEGKGKGTQFVIRLPRST